MRCKIIAEIRQKKFDAALELTKGHEQDLAFERAYILHRQGKNTDALQALKKIEDKSAASQHLMCQIVRYTDLLTK